MAVVDDDEEEEPTSSGVAAFPRAPHPVATHDAAWPQLVPPRLPLGRADDPGGTLEPLPVDPPHQQQQQPENQLLRMRDDDDMLYL